uniref:Uncharacterized protein n=1 Tax=Trichogramma kaykai TaxID=54128 RepID=A0ABD2WZY4_9HYME
MFGSGVACYVRDDLPTKIVYHPKITHVDENEVLSVAVAFAKRKILLNSVYRHPKDDARCWAFLRRLGLIAASNPSPLDFFSADDFIQHYQSVSVCHPLCSDEALEAIIAEPIPVSSPEFRFSEASAGERLEALLHVAHYCTVPGADPQRFNCHCQLSCAMETLNHCVTQQGLSASVTCSDSPDHQSASPL